MKKTEQMFAVYACGIIDEATISFDEQTAIRKWTSVFKSDKEAHADAMKRANKLYGDTVIKVTITYEVPE